MKSYGIATVQDGVLKTDQNILEEERERRMGFARFSSVREIFPKPILTTNKNNKSVSVDLFYKEKVHSFNGKLISNNRYVEYSKKANKIISTKNIVKELKNVVSQYADCNEAKRIRGVALALQKIKPTISNENFKFLISGNEGGCPQGSFRWRQTNDV